MRVLLLRTNARLAQWEKPFPERKAMIMEANKALGSEYLHSFKTDPSASLDYSQCDYAHSAVGQRLRSM